MYESVHVPNFQDGLQSYTQIRKTAKQVHNSTTDTRTQHTSVIEK